MTQIQLTMKNFPFAEQLKAIFEKYSDDYEYTSEGIFRKIIPPLCNNCGTPMNHNGFNNHTKKLENYYSCSLKTHRKQQLDVPGIEEQMKLSRLKRWGMFGIPQKTLIEAFFVFIPFMDWK